MAYNIVHIVRVHFALNYSLIKNIRTLFTLRDLLHHNLQVRILVHVNDKAEYGTCAMMLQKKTVLVNILSAV